MIVYDPTVSQRYAQALLNVTKRLNTQVDALKDVDEFQKLASSGVKIRTFFEGPQISLEEKRHRLDTIFKGKLNPSLYKMFDLLLVKGRVEYAPAILEEFRILSERDQGIYAAEISTAQELGAEDRQKLQTVLEKFTKAKLRLRYHVDPSLIGGVKFSYGDTLIDNTVKGKLQKLRQALETAIAL